MNGFKAQSNRLAFQVYKHGYQFLPGLRPRPRGAQVLLYHNVETTECTLVNKLGVTLSPRNFAEHIGYLASNYSLLPFERVCRERGGPPAVAVTVDDGFRSILTTVLPVIERYHCPIKIYLTTSHIHQGISWLNQLSHLMNVLSTQELNELAAGALALPPERRGRPATIWDFINFFDVARTPALLSEAFARRHSGPRRCLYLNEEEVRRLASHPLVTLGSHTRNHYPLPRLDRRQLHEEVVANHDHLRNLFANRVQGFCLPFGFVSDMTKEVVEAVQAVDAFVVSSYGGRLDDNRVHGLPEVKRIGMWGTLGTLWYRLRYAA
jgi:peptidoglycan/xylan/chitin deacetylase (PgdA/CDA1 family)